MEQKSKILVADDDLISNKILVRFLEKEGYEVITAVDGKDALEKAKQYHPDIILTDIMMPNLSGFELCQQVRADKDLADIPIIMVTAIQDKESKLLGLQYGADEFILKPFDISELKARVKSITKLNRYRRIIDERKKFEKIVELLPEGILVIEKNGLIRQANNKSLIILGSASFEDLIGKDISEFVVDNQKENFKSTINKILLNSSVLSENALHFETIFYAANDESHQTPVEVSIGQFEWDNNPSVLILLHDISERKESEEKILSQAALLDKAQDAIIAIDLDDHVTYMNLAAEKLYGWLEKEVKGKNINEFFNRQHLPEYAEAHFHVKEKGEWSGIITQTTRENQIVIVESRWSLIIDNRGKEKSILIIDRDITDKVNLEERFLRAQRMENIGALASGIAHDLNNILSPIMLASQMLKSISQDKTNQELLEALYTNAQRGARLVKQILTFARGIGREKISLQIKHLIKEIKKISEETFPKSIEFSIDTPKELWLVNADPTQIDQVLMNLCVNARDAMPSGGKISISASNYSSDKVNINDSQPKMGDYVRIVVQDTGTGIPPDVIDKIFEPFFTTKEIGKGTGLGLSTVNSIIKEHGGFISVESEKDQGTKFNVFIPAIKSEEQKQEIHKETNYEIGNNETILVVDDEPSICEITKKILKNYGYSVLTSNNGAEAVKTFNENSDKIKVILLDMIMPVMDGPLCIKAIRKISTDVKIIAVTGYAEIEKYIEAIGSQVETFLPKPYSTEKLLNLLKEALKNK